MAPAEPKPEKRTRCGKYIDKKNPPTAGSLKKRKSTLKNKASELATLCDVMVCVVCFGPDGEVETWPESETEVGRIISKYKGVTDEKDSNKQKLHKHDLVGFLERKEKKIEEKMNKSVEKGKDTLKEDIGNMFPNWDEKLKQFSPQELMGLCNSLDAKLETLRDRIQLLQHIKESNDANAMQVVDYGWNNPNPSYLDMLVNDDESGEFGGGAIWPRDYYPDGGSSGNGTGERNIIHNHSSSDSLFDFGRPNSFDFVGPVAVGDHINNNLLPDNNYCLGFVQADTDNLGFMRETSNNFCGHSVQYYSTLPVQPISIWRS